jgi:hypothetical protein
MRHVPRPLCPQSWLWGGLLALSIGCAAPLPDAALGPPPWSRSGYSASSEPTSSPGTSEAEPRAEPTPKSRGASKFEALGARAQRPLPQNEACLNELRAEGITFAPGKAAPGIQTPVTVSGKLAGLTFWANDKRPLLMDCRLALALARLEPTFTRFRVSGARFSGAYVRKTTRSGRLSHHAYGLAIDIHALIIDGEEIEIRSGFRKGVGCGGRSSALNQLACELRKSGYFEEFLTPDYNADHADHLHLSVPLRAHSSPPTPGLAKRTSSSDDVKVARK